MPDNKDERKDIYTIPPNFIDTGSLFGGMVKLRNAIEAGIIAVASAIPIINLELDMTAKIVILCFVSLPVTLFALIGWNGESLSAFAFSICRFIKNRRIVGLAQSPKKKKKVEYLEPEGVLHKSKAHFFFKSKQRKAALFLESTKEKVVTVDKKSNVLVRHKRNWIKIINETATYLPIKDLKHGVTYTNDGRYVKMIEVTPINFTLRNANEQRNIIYAFVSYLKVSTVKMQMKILTKKADTNKHIERVRADIANEKDEKCRELQEDYIELVRGLGTKEAVTRRFFIIFEYEPDAGVRASEIEALSQLSTVVTNAASYLRQCGNSVLLHDDEDEFVVEALYSILNRKMSVEKPISENVKSIIQKYLDNSWDVNNIPVTEFIAPSNIDFSHYNYIKIDDSYISYMYIPSDGYKPQVMAGWISLLVNAGEGIDVDIFTSKQPKHRMKGKLSQQIRINRSKIKDTEDTNDDFEDLANSIKSGYFLRDGLSSNQDFYYVNILVTITANNPKELKWRVGEMKKLMISQDLDIRECNFRQEQAFLSTLPLVSLDKNIFGLSKRNALTVGVASCYPFTSFEMSDENGIMLGVNKQNNSLIIVDIFNSRIYKNANMVILGTSGAGKTFTMQLMALRMRRKNIQTFILAPLKGHEFYRACANIGGEFIQISPASSHCINVMEIRKMDTVASELLDEMDDLLLESSLLASKIQKLLIFFSLLVSDLTEEEEQLVDEALVRTYAKKGITHDNDSLIDPHTPDKFKEMPILGDLHELIVQIPQTKRIANILNKFVNGSAKTFNKQTNVKLDNKYTVLDISQLSGSMLTIGMFVALDYVWDQAKADRTVEKAIFIDEVWKLIGASSNYLAANFVLEIVKIIRGYGGSATCSTQDINDFFALDGGKYGKGIINNAKTKIVLNLEEEEAQSVQSIMHLSAAEVMEITHFQRGNGLISTNNNNILVEFKASDYEKTLITSDRQELKEILDKKRKEKMA